MHTHPALFYIQNYKMQRGVAISKTWLKNQNNVILVHF